MTDRKKHLLTWSLGMVLLSSAATEPVPIDLAGFRPQGANAATIRLDPQETKEGHAALLFDMPDFTDTQVQQRIAVTPGRYYRVTATVKLDCPYIEERGFGGLRLIVSDPEGQWLGWTPPLTAVSNGWVTYDLTFASEDNTEIVLLWHAAEGKGRAWVGAMTLEEITADAVGNVTPPDPASAEWPEHRGLRLFAHSPEDMFFPTRVPRPEELNRKPTAAGARGETVNMALGVFASEPLFGVSVECVGPLRKDDSKAELASDRVEIRYLKPERFPVDRLRYWEYGVFMRPNRPIDIPALENRRYFFTAAIPEDAEPGTYRGRIRVTADRIEPVETEFELEVYNFTLPPSHCRWFVYHNGPWEARIARDMARHGMNTATLYEKAPDSLETGLAALRAGGLSTPGNPPVYLYCNDADWTATFVPPLTRLPELKELWRQSGWDELMIYCVDEPNSPERIAEAKRAAAALRRSPTPVTITTAIGVDGLKALAQDYDRLIFDTMAMAPILPYRTPGQPYWVYECRMNGKSPRVDRYSFGVYPYAAGAEGAAQWVYTDENRTADGLTGLAYGYVLIEPDDLVPSVGWEAKRTGINDHRYLELLEQLLTQVPDPEAPEARAAAALLREIRTRVDLNSFRARKERMTGVEFCLDNTPEPEWPEHQLELWRRQLAQHITILQGMIDDKDK